MAVCLPGSKKAVAENLDIIFPVLGHILELIGDEKISIEKTHKTLQGGVEKSHDLTSRDNTSRGEHVCPHKKGLNSHSAKGDGE